MAGAPGAVGPVPRKVPGRVAVEIEEYQRMFDLEERYWWFRAKRALVASLLDRFASGPPGRALDLGCGTGGTLAAFAPRGERWVGMDLSGVALAFCQKRGLRRIARGSAVALPFKDGSFDLVLCLDLLYHQGVESDRLALAECARTLRPGGLVVVTDSAFEFLRGPHDRAVHARHRYRIHEVRDLVSGAGLTILKATYTGCLLFLPVAALRLWERRSRRGERPESDLRPLPPPVERVLLWAQALERRLLGRVDLPFGSSVCCVARKAA